MILYKYLGPAQLRVLRDCTIRFTQPGDFNDPFEFRPRIEAAASDAQVREYVSANYEAILDQELSKYGQLSPAVPKSVLKDALLTMKDRLPQLFHLLEPRALSAVSQFVDRYLSEKVGVLCLSEVRDSLLMWAHYTDSHRGLVLGFDASHAFFNQRRGDQDEFGFLRRVLYQRERPSVVLSDTSSPVWFQTKSECWLYEREWRIVRILAEAHSRDDRVPFPICLFEFPPDAVVEIIAGIRMPPTAIEEIKSLACKFPRAAILRAREDTRAYALSIERLS